MVTVPPPSHPFCTGIPSSGRRRLFVPPPVFQRLFDVIRSVRRFFFPLRAAATVCARTCCSRQARSGLLSFFLAFFCDPLLTACVATPTVHPVVFVCFEPSPTVLRRNAIHASRGRVRLFVTAVSRAARRCFRRVVTYTVRACTACCTVSPRVVDLTPWLLYHPRFCFGRSRWGYRHHREAWVVSSSPYR